MENRDVHNIYFERAQVGIFMETIFSTINMHAQTQNKFLFPLLCVDRGPKYHLLAHTTLSLSHVQDSFRTHDLTISGNGEWHPSSVSLLTIFLFSLPNQPSVCFFFVPLSLIAVSLLFPAFH